MFIAASSVSQTGVLQSVLRLFLVFHTEEKYQSLHNFDLKNSFNAAQVLSLVALGAPRVA